MTTALVNSRAQIGLTSPGVQVEVHLPNGLPGFTSTGISGAELRDRVKAAIQNSAFDFHRGRIVVNLGPAELPKSGGRYDLAIAAAILIASDELAPDALDGYELLGELSLFGDVRSIRGGLSAAREATAAGRTLLCPAANGPEFAGTPGLRVRLINHLNELTRLDSLAAPDTTTQPIEARSQDPLRSVIGQSAAKRALTIAAAGGHHMLMTGPPGSGKTMLAELMRDLLPPLTPEQRSAVAEIYSLSGLPAPPPGCPPFRAPHHSASAAAMTGGGSPPLPGEISHAHQGVLFMDEMPEFRRDALEALREPLEGGQIRISRRGSAVSYPARFQLIAAMNPCPMGLVCKPATCRCSPDQAQRYKNRISAPILDRIDLHISVAAVPLGQLFAGAATADRNRPDQRVALIRRARSMQLERNGCLNAHLTTAQTERLCVCPAPVQELLQKAADKLRLSARGYFRALRVARTIIDLDWLQAQSEMTNGPEPITDPETDPEKESETEQASEGVTTRISKSAIAEALGYRAVDN